LTPAPEGAPKDLAGRWYVLTLLTATLALNIADRQIIGILQDSIKADLGLSDTQLGLLGGVAFGLFYVTMGLGIARIADRYSRKCIIAGSLALWSVMSGLCGLAGSYGQLFLARMGVGIGEAGASPPSHSMIADYFNPGERATALGIYATGFTLGTVIAFLFGGWVDHIWGWRAAFLMVGLPGLALALLIAWTVREPSRGYWERGARATSVVPRRSLGKVIKLLGRRRSLLHVMLGSSLQAVAFMGVSLWLPSFLRRSYSMTTLEAGQTLALIIGVIGTLGSVIGGLGGDRIAKGDRRWSLWFLVAANLLTAPFAIGGFLAPTITLMLMLLGTSLFFGNLHHGTIFALVQSLAEPEIRVTASALLLFINGIVAVGIAPIVIGIGSDLLRPVYGGESLRITLALVTCVHLCAIIHYVLASRSFSHDLNLVGKN
jgi:predicted MFS family arabinose efflux permease